MTQEKIREFARRLPKCELHLHFEGAVPMELVRRWSTEPIPERPVWREHDYRYNFFADFGEVMRLTWRETCDTPDKLNEASSLIYRQLLDQNVRYLEMSFGVGAYPEQSSEILAAFKADILEGMTVKIIGGISRDRDTPAILKSAYEYLDVGGMDGIDLHGNETVGDLAEFVAVYEAANERGMICKAHAGELRGPESVEQVLDTLKVKRVQHGVRGIESEDLVKRYHDDAVTLDLCPWSNVKLGVYPDLRSHPVADLYRQGVRVTINTDDPTPFGQTLTDEYTWLVTECGMTTSEVGAIAKNGFEVADMPDESKRKSVEEIDQLVTEFEVT